MKSVKNDLLIIVRRSKRIAEKRTVPSAMKPDVKSIDAEDEDKNVKTLLHKYQDLLTTYPLLMNMIQGTILSTLSVLTSQYLTYLKTKEFNIDYVEIYVMAAIMAFFITPVLLWFYKSVLDRVPGGK
jgi:hypothetical protein